MVGQATAAPADECMPCIAVYSSLFPSAMQPQAGLFVRERMFRVAPAQQLVVISPQPWFPMQALIRWLRPGYRPPMPRKEVQSGVDVWFPRFLSVPGVFRRFDGLSMALCTWPLLRRLRSERGVAVIDSHFAYPCGYAAVLLGRWLGLPVSITLRGTEYRHLAAAPLRKRVLAAIAQASCVFSVSDSLRQLVVRHGADASKVHVVGNGVDLAKFRRLPHEEARGRLGLLADAPVLVSVGGLVERKGFHRVIDLLPVLRERFPGLRYLVVGGPSPEGDLSAQLREQVARLGLGDTVVFTGPLAPSALCVPLSAADVFVLSTSNEGWANVFLEAMACGLPVVATDVGGNREVVREPFLGRIVPFGDARALSDAIAEALTTQWDSERIVAYAKANGWEQRVAVLRRHFGEMTAVSRAAARVPS